jgi:iron(III) transport system permease protein
VTALKALDAEFESVSASLKVPFYKTFWRVTLPICTPALVDIARYFFINAMTTISAVVFLYSPETKVGVDRHPEPRRSRRDRRARQRWLY